MDLFDVVGWVGMILVLVAYALLLSNRIKNGFAYQALNLVAAILMAIGLFPKNAWFSFALQIVWGVVAVVTIVRLKAKITNRQLS